MSMPKFPKPDILYEAVTTYQDGLISADQIGTLARNWPPDSNPQELANMELEENEIWDKAESYMIQILEPSDLIHRLNAWKFKYDYEDDKTYMNNFSRQMTELFKFVEDNEVIYKIFGMALAIGNIMNGGTPKGRSDGYELKVIGKFASTKGNDGKTMMTFILKELLAFIPEKIYAFKEDAKIFSTKATDTEVFKGKIREVKSAVNAAGAAYKQVQTSGEEPDNFTKTYGNDLKVIENNLVTYEKIVDEFTARHTKLCDFFQLEAKDEKRESSDEFFKFWKQFAKEVETNIPAPEKKRAGARK